MIAPLDDHSADRYCDWRKRWRAGGRSQAVGVLCRHGLAHALALTATLPQPAPACEPAFSPRIPASVITQAVSMIRDVLPNCDA